MKAEFKRSNKGLELVLIPESGQDRTMMDELVNDRLQNIFLNSKWDIEITRRNSSDSVASLSISRKTNLTGDIIMRYGFSGCLPGEISIPCSLYWRKMSRFTYIIFGTGVYSVFKTQYDFDGAIFGNGFLNLLLGKDIVESLHKRKDRIAVIQTLSDLENFLKQK